MSDFAIFASAVVIPKLSSVFNPPCDTGTI